MAVRGIVGHKFDLVEIPVFAIKYYIFWLRLPQLTTANGSKITKKKLPLNERRMWLKECGVYSRRSTW